jgi:hypothetical protein
MPVNELTQLVSSIVVIPQSAANTAAATSSGIDLQGYVGVIEIVQTTGAITGTLDGKIQGSVDNSAFNDLSTAADGLCGPQVTATTKQQKCTISVNSIVTSAGYCRYIKYVGTVATGPVLISVVLNGFKAYKP